MCAVLLCCVYCLCVNVYCTNATGCQYKFNDNSNNNNGDICHDFRRQECDSKEAVKILKNKEFTIEKQRVIHKHYDDTSNIMRFPKNFKIFQKIREHNEERELQKLP
jgi:hypothetical protein